MAIKKLRKGGEKKGGENNADHRPLFCGNE